MPRLFTFLFCVFIGSSVSAPLAGAAEQTPSITTYSKAYGQTKGTVTVDPQRELPRYPPVEAAAAVDSWQIKRGFRMQLAAHEPQVRDPVALCFDERGRMFVCEMIDYSEMRDAQPHLGRITVLTDENGDGHYERSTVFADNLPWPTGLIWANGGLYVGATPDIWRFEDHDEDCVAESRKIVFTGFGTGLKLLNVQGLLNSFQWGVDQRVHVLAGGGNRGVITCPSRPELAGLELGGKDFWFDPRTHDFGLETGGAQYGMSFDDYGRKFGCANSDHLQFWVYDDHAGKRNTSPHALPPSRQSIAVDGGAAEVFRISPDEPWRIIRTRWRVSGVVPGVKEGGGRVSGYFTGATGTTIYRGDAYGADFVNNSFTGDAGGQLIHRKVIRESPDGVSLLGERLPDERTAEFAASTDTWVRVVNFANAPDGCLYVCDMYREIIEHPWSIPDEIKQHLDLNHGNDRGRIYRIVPEVGAPRVGQPVNLGSATTSELVRYLSHPNGWHRDTAARLLHERQDRSAIPLLKAVQDGEGSVNKLHALAVLEGYEALSDETVLRALNDSNAHVRERALASLTRRKCNALPARAVTEKLATMDGDVSRRVRFQLARTLGALLETGDDPKWTATLTRLAIRDHAHPWIGPAILSVRPQIAERVLFPAMTANDSLMKEAAPFVAKLIEGRAVGFAAASAPEQEAFMRFIAGSDENPLWMRAFGEGLRRAGLTIEKADANQLLTPKFEHAARVAMDHQSGLSIRVAALEYLAFAPLPIAMRALEFCLQPGQALEVQTAAVNALAARADDASTRLLVAKWHDGIPPIREAIIRSLMARTDRQAALLDAIAENTISAAALNAAQIQALVGHKEKALAQRARQVLAAVLPPSREESIARYQPAIAMQGDGTRGALHFAQRCAVCHRAAGQGVQVGPDLVTVKNKGREALLTAILAPGKEVPPAYIVYTIETKRGEVYSGFIADDLAGSVTLKLPGGTTQTVQRADIKSTSSEGLSLMPIGLESGLSIQEMADLFTFIEQLP